MRRTDSSVENEDFPKWMFGPGGASQLVASAAEIPEGFVSHPKDVREDGSLPDKTDEVPLTRAQITEALKERKLPFKQTAPTKALYDQLVAAVEASGEA